MHFLSPEQIRQINAKVVSASGGSTGAVNEANLHHVCERAKTVSKSIYRVAAYYLHSFAYSAHAFVDGNKRTAIGSTVEFLGGNGYAINARDDELVGMGLMAASGNASLSEVEKWLKARIKKG